MSDIEITHGDVYRWPVVLFLDLLAGNQTLFVRRDETEAAWAWIDAIADGWNARDMTPLPYAAGPDRCALTLTAVLMWLLCRV